MAAAQENYIVVLGGNTIPPDSIDGIAKEATVLDDLTATAPDPGSRATAGLPTLSAGAIATALLATAGGAYKNLGDMSAAEKTCTLSGGDGSGAVIEIGGVTNGAITSLTVVSGGTGYTTPPTVIIPNPTGEPQGLPWPDGVGYGEIYPSQKRVLIINDGRSALGFVLIAGNRLDGWGSVAITGAVGSCYIPFKVE